MSVCAPRGRGRGAYRASDDSEEAEAASGGVVPNLVRFRRLVLGLIWFMRLVLD